MSGGHAEPSGVLTLSGERGSEAGGGDQEQDTVQQAATREQRANQKQAGAIKNKTRYGTQQDTVQRRGRQQETVH